MLLDPARAERFLDLGAFAATLGRLLADPELAARIGVAGRERVRDMFLGDKHLIRYMELFAVLIGARPSLHRDRARERVDAAQDVVHA